MRSRIESAVQEMINETRVGNNYVNRNQICAVVGFLPVVAIGLSGTGPKAGEPNYLARFACEHVVTNNVTAEGATWSF